MSYISIKVESQPIKTKPKVSFKGALIKVAKTSKAPLAMKIKALPKDDTFEAALNVTVFYSAKSLGRDRVQA